MSCIHCKEDIQSDGYGEFIHILDVEGKDIPGNYMCHTIGRRDNPGEPRFQLCATPA